MHPYYTERVLARSQPLAAMGRLGALHHERLDGSGYHRAAIAPQLSNAARILGAADAYQALTEPRPYRAARSSEEATFGMRMTPERFELMRTGMANPVALLLTRKLRVRGIRQMGTFGRLFPTPKLDTPIPWSTDEAN